MASANPHSKPYKQNEQNIKPLTPKLHHLNVDSSWLLQIPRRPSQPSSTSSQHDPSARPRKYFNILIDPWLAGSQTDVGIWLSKQWFREGDESAYDSIAKVEALLRRTEGLDAPNGKGNDRNTVESSLVDAVVICHEFTDHCHEATLRQLPRSVPIFANPNPAALVASWHHFDTIHVVQPFGATQAEQPAEKVTAVSDTPPDTTTRPEKILQSPHLPQGFDVRYLSGGYNGKNIGLPFHVALVIAFAIYNHNDQKHHQELLMYTPHGVPPAALAPLLALSDHDRPPLRCLLHGRNEFHLAGLPVNLGARNGLDVVDALNPKYWIGTHDPLKNGVGIVQTFLRRTVVDVEEVVRERGGDGDGEGRGKEGRAVFRELGNGESIELV